MKIGVAREIKPQENRVALTPAGVRTLVAHGHEVRAERGSGEGSGFADDDYRRAGAIVVEREELFGVSDLVTKVKEPLPEEYGLFREGQVLYTYLHLAPERALTEALMRVKVAAIAYETVQRDDRSLPLLTPMSEVAGRMAAQVGAQFLEKAHGGKGILLGGVPGVLPGRVVIVGGGTVGQNAATIALGMGAEVTVVDISLDKLRMLDDLYRGEVHTLTSNEHNIGEAVAAADLVIGAVLLPGARAPHLVTEPMVAAMTAGSVIVDVAIDQGGVVETSDHVTTHADPVYLRHGVVHYAVANMPGAVPRTSTLALTNATLPYLVALADKGLRRAVQEDAALRRGVNVWDGCVTHEAVASAHGLLYTPVDKLIAA